MTNRGLAAAVVVLALLAGACGRTAGMQAVPQITVAPPGPGEAVVVFMRPSNVGEMYSTSVFELRSDGDRFVGILRGQTRSVHRMSPGRTRFMLVVAGGWDHYMDADLAGGKTYYAAIGYDRIGDRSGYVLRPVRLADQEGAEFKACMSSCTWVENTEKSEAWGRNHLRELPRRKAQTLASWEALSSRPMLTAADGR
jgi:hypothetical protein